MARNVSIMFIVVCLILTGCGPMTAPMPVRLDEKSQAEVDSYWEKAMTPIDRLDGQLLLDTLVGTHAYQNGVDKLSFRSEKNFSGGVVIMEVHYDRTKPHDDRFEVRVLNAQGKQVRMESYSRIQVATTNSELFDKPKELAKDEIETPEMAAKRARYKARWDKIFECFPKEKLEQK